MTIKEKVLVLLEKNMGNYLSGEEIAGQLDCTRGAVWKAVKTLQNQGYNINAVTNKGYKLDENTDILSLAGIEQYLDEEVRNMDIEVFHSVSSTNDIVKDFANQGGKEGKVVISGMQTKGKGRLGRSFYSPSDSGLYMSILLRPEMSAADAVKITTAAAVAVAQSVEKVSDQNTNIKWVNDVYLNGKKICGILTEASFNLENGGLDYAVVGIGVNVYQPDGGFPEEIKDIAGAVFKEKIGTARNRICAYIINSFMKYYHELDENTFYDGYRSRLMWAGEKINIISPKETVPATLLDVDKDCKLLVKLENDEEKTISTGEISIRKR